MTGKNKLGDFFSTQNTSDSSSQKSAREAEQSGTLKKPARAPNATAETTLDQLLDLATPYKMTGLQAEQLNKPLDGKTVILFGYLIDSRRTPFWGASAEISSSKDGERTFYLNIDSDKDSWAIPKGSYIGVQTTLKQPLLGTMVGDKAKLLQVGKEGEQVGQTTR